jgi:hypothetical protein
MPHTTHGLWSESSVPHRGWTYVNFFDLGTPSQICAMCQVMEIRYVHVVTHPNYNGSLEVGCVCCEHLTEDYVNPRLHQEELQRKAKRRKRKPALAYPPTWQPQPTRSASSLPPRWFWAEPGQARTIVDGFEITVGRERGSTIRRVGENFWAPGWCRSQTIEQVVQAALSMVASMKTKGSG